MYKAICLLKAFRWNSVSLRDPDMPVKYKIPILVPVFMLMRMLTQRNLIYSSVRTLFGDRAELARRILVSKHVDKISLP